MCQPGARMWTRELYMIGVILRLVGALALTWFLLKGAPAHAQAEVKAREPYEEAVRGLESWVAGEVKEKGLPALSVALIDDQEIVWASGFGLADPWSRTPASAETVYRVGSVSKLFTDLAVMQLVERGLLDLDVPVKRYLTEFSPRDPSKTPITLRHLLAHRSGLVREPPVGHYFDPVRRTLAETVKSLNTTELVYPPGSRTKYSNAGIAVAGRVLEQVRNEPFAAYLQRAVIDPLGLKWTGFEPSPALEGRLAKGTMWTYDGRTFPAPTFELGTVPATNLASTVLDLGRFVSALFAGGRGIVKPETLEEMLRPQFAEAGGTPGFGLGFALSSLDGHRRVGHDGAIYGFATELAVLPDEKLGAVVIASRDYANGVARRIADSALRLMLAAEAKQPLPALETTAPVPGDLARRAEGHYAKGKTAADLVALGDKLFMTSTGDDHRAELRLLGEALVVDDPIDFGTKLELGEDQVVLRGDTLAREAVARPSAPPTRWEGLIGEYGWDHNTLYILEKDGALHALIEWFFLYPLTEVSPDVYRFPDWGLYDGETLRFTRDIQGRAIQVVAAEVLFKRRPISGEGGTIFRIQPLRPVPFLHAEALAARPPKEEGDFREPDLVELSSLDPTIRRDIRYASVNNFLGTPFYTSALAYLQRPAAEALKKAHESLKKSGYGLLIHDAYRPWYVTKMFWDATPGPSRIFVADPAKGSKHNRGAAVDLTLYDLRIGLPIPMVGGYDEFSDRSNPAYPGGTSLQRWHRDLLRRAMEAQGFTVNEVEWWHFDYKDWKSYPILNVRFEDIRNTAAPRPGR